MDDSANRQLLSASSRQKKADEDDLEDLAKPKAGPTPGKLTRVEEPAAPPSAADGATPTRRVDRRAEPAHGEVDDGALVTAFGFIRDATSGPGRKICQRFRASPCTWWPPPATSAARRPAS